MRGPGARQPCDDDRLLDFDVEDLWVTLQQVMEAQTICRVANHVVVETQPAHWPEPGILIGRLAPDPKPLDEVGWPEVGKAGALLGIAEHGIHREGDLGPRHALEHHLLHRREDRLSKVVDVDVVGALGHDGAFLAMAAPSVAR